MNPNPRKPAMNLGSICTRRVITIDTQQSLQQAAQLVRDQHVGALVVTQDMPEGRRIVGIVTDRDLAIEVLANGALAPRQNVGQFVDGTLVSAPAQAGLSQAIDLMRAAGVRRLLVRDDHGHLAGIVSFDDLLDACAQQLAGLADVVRKGIQREAAERAEAAAPQALSLQLPAIGTAAWQMAVA
jgi:CBS domain-containing protein